MMQIGSKKIAHKKIVSDKQEFYLLIKENLSSKSFRFNDTNFNVTENNKKFINSTRKSLSNQTTQIDRGNFLLDVTMGKYDGIEVFVLVYGFFLSSCFSTLLQSIIKKPSSEMVVSQFLKDTSRI